MSYEIWYNKIFKNLNEREKPWNAYHMIIRCELCLDLDSNRRKNQLYLWTDIDDINSW